MSGATPFELTRTELSGSNLVEAGAGTGKTYTIEGVFLRLLLEKQLPVDGILVVTFTEAATAELRERIWNRINEAVRAFEDGRSDDGFLNSLLAHSSDYRESLKILKSALARFDEAAISTIHGFCHRQLLDNAFESGSRFDSEFVKDQWDLLLEIVRDFWREQAYGADPHWTVFIVGELESPEKKAAEVSGLLARPVAGILPAFQNEENEFSIDPGTQQAKVSSRFAELARIWTEERDTLETILTKDPGLNHRSYAKNHVKNWMAEMDGFISMENPFILPAKFDRFTLQAIEENQSGKAEIPDHRLFHLCSSLMQDIEQCRILLQVEMIGFVRRELKDRKESRGLLSFDDLLKNLKDALSGNGGERLAGRIREQFSVALIDEFQDTDPIQFEIFDTIFKNGDTPLFFIGDPKQAIYSFRGADIFAYLEARTTADRTYTLLTNWRSDHSLIQAINTVFGFRDAPFLFPEIEFNPAEGSTESRDSGLLIGDNPADPFILWTIGDEGDPVPKTEAKRRTARSVAGEITRLLTLARDGDARIITGHGDVSRALVPEDIAVLVRSNSEAELVQAELRRLDVPGVVNTKATVFEDSIFVEIIVLLNAVADAWSERNIRRALATDLLGFSGEQLAGLMSDENDWEEILEEFQEYRRLWVKEGFFAMMRALVEKRCIKIRLLEKAAGERRLTNFLHGLELLYQAENDQHLGMAGLVKWAEQMTLKGVRGREETEIRLETDENAVRIMTIHASKGLEFPVVFCPFCWGVGGDKHAWFHDAENGNALTLDLGSDGMAVHRRQAEREALAEEIRLFYVALTRARNRCTLVWGNINKTEKSAPAWLFHDGKQPGENWREDLDRLATLSEGRIRLMEMPEEEVTPFTRETEAAPDLQRLEFPGFSAPDWRISSFTSLSTKSARHSEQPDRDQAAGDFTLDAEQQPADRSLSMFTLPKGARTGNCFHEIFEKVEFHERNPTEEAEIVEKTLKRYGLDPEWQPVATRLIGDLLATPLPAGDCDGPSFTLGSVEKQDRLTEMEFYFPLQAVSSKAISGLVRKHLKTDTAQSLLTTIDRLDFSELPGFMKGFVDLIIHHEGRYYIIDWKTNFLGFQAENYNPGRLKEYMVAHSYVLQYMIYAVALHRMLRLNLSDYSYETHFGGVFYIFLRGVRGASQPESGIYRDSMNGCGGLIEALSGLLGGDAGRKV